MNPEHLRAFAGRDWDAIRRSRLAYWADRYRLEGSAPARAAATHLYEHAIRIGAPIHDQRNRADDLAGHRHLRDCLDRASRAFSGR